MNRASRAATLAAYRDGITVICELAVQFSDAAWLGPTPCAEWRAVELAGHLRCVADDYHEYLDDAPDSRLARLMATGVPADSLARKLARQNAAELAALPDGPGEEHIAAFAESARAYGRRLYAVWEQPHHAYRGHVVTVGAMAGLACAEWHLHAWDLARSLGKDYRPADPGLVQDAWWAGMPQLWTPVTPESPVGLLAAPVAAPAHEAPAHEAPADEAAVHEADDDPWLSLLGASGRDPGWIRVLR